MSSYTPKPGSVAYRILGWLEAQGREKEFNASQIGNALDIDTRAIQSLMQQALAAGLVFRRQKDRTHPLAPYWWSLTNHGVRQREFTPNPVGWMNVKKNADEVPVFCEVSGRTKSPRMADAGSGAGASSPSHQPSPTVTNLPGHPLADDRSKAARAAVDAISIAPNSQRHESGAQHGGDAGNMAHNTEHAAPLGGLAEGEGATAPSPGLREAKADEGTPGTPPSRGRIELAVPQFRSTPRTITRKDAEESGSKPGTPGAPDGVGTSSAPRAADGAPSGEGPAAADAPRARAAESTDAKFALFCDGELMVSRGGSVIQLKAEHVQRLRRLLGATG